MQEVHKSHQVNRPQAKTLEKSRNPVEALYSEANQLIMALKDAIKSEKTKNQLIIASVRERVPEATPGFDVNNLSFDEKEARQVLLSSIQRSVYQMTGMQIPPVSNSISNQSLAKYERQVSKLVEKHGDSHLKNYIELSEVLEARFSPKKVEIKGKFSPDDGSDKVVVGPTTPAKPNPMVYKENGERRRTSAFIASGVQLLSNLMAAGQLALSQPNMASQELSQLQKIELIKKADASGKTEAKLPGGLTVKGLDGDINTFDSERASELLKAAQMLKEARIAVEAQRNNPSNQINDKVVSLISYLDRVSTPGASAEVEIVAMNSDEVIPVEQTAITAEIVPLQDLKPVEANKTPVGEPNTDQLATTESNMVANFTTQTQAPETQVEVEPVASLDAKEQLRSIEDKISRIRDSGITLKQMNQEQKNEFEMLVSERSRLKNSNSVAQKPNEARAVEAVTQNSSEVTDANLTVEIPLKVNVSGFVSLDKRTEIIPGKNLTKAGEIKNTDGSSVLYYIEKDDNGNLRFLFGDGQKYYPITADSNIDFENVFNGQTKAIQDLNVVRVIKASGWLSNSLLAKSLADQDGRLPTGEFIIKKEEVNQKLTSINSVKTIEFIDNLWGAQFITGQKVSGDIASGSAAAALLANLMNSNSDKVRIVELVAYQQSIVALLPELTNQYKSILEKIKASSGVEKEKLYDEREKLLQRMSVALNVSKLDFGYKDGIITPKKLQETASNVGGIDGYEAAKNAAKVLLVQTVELVGRKIDSEKSKNSDLYVNRDLENLRIIWTTKFTGVNKGRLPTDAETKEAIRILESDSNRFAESLDGSTITQGLAFSLPFGLAYFKLFSWDYKNEIKKDTLQAYAQRAGQTVEAFGADLGMEKGTAKHNEKSELTVDVAQTIAAALGGNIGFSVEHRREVETIILASGVGDESVKKIYELLIEKGDNPGVPIFEKIQETLGEYQRVAGLFGALNIKLPNLQIPLGPNWSGIAFWSGRENKYIASTEIRSTEGVLPTTRDTLAAFDPSISKEIAEKMERQGLEFARSWNDPNLNFQSQFDNGIRSQLSPEGAIAQIKIRKADGSYEVIGAKKASEIVESLKSAHLLIEASKINKHLTNVQGVIPIVIKNLVTDINSRIGIAIAPENLTDEYRIALANANDKINANAYSEYLGQPDKYKISGAGSFSQYFKDGTIAQMYAIDGSRTMFIGPEVKVQRVTDKSGNVVAYFADHCKNIIVIPNVPAVNVEFKACVSYCLINSTVRTTGITSDVVPNWLVELANNNGVSINTLFENAKLFEDFEKLQFGSLNNVQSIIKELLTSGDISEIRNKYKDSLNVKISNSLTLGDFIRLSETPAGKKTLLNMVSGVPVSQLIAIMKTGSEYSHFSITVGIPKSSTETGDFKQTGSESSQSTTREKVTPDLINEVRQTNPAKADELRQYLGREVDVFRAFSSMTSQREIMSIRSAIPISIAGVGKSDSRTLILGQNWLNYTLDDICKRSGIAKDDIVLRQKVFNWLLSLNGQIPADVQKQIEQMKKVNTEIDTRVVPIPVPVPKPNPTTIIINNGKVTPFTPPTKINPPIKPPEKPPTSRVREGGSGEYIPPDKVLPPPNTVIIRNGEGNATPITIPASGSVPVETPIGLGNSQVQTAPTPSVIFNANPGSNARFDAGGVSGITTPAVNLGNSVNPNSNGSGRITIETTPSTNLSNQINVPGGGTINIRGGVPANPNAPSVTGNGAVRPQ